MSDKLPEAQNDSTDEMPVVSIGRILVALDASPHSLNALRAAAELAAVTESELQGLYVEDLNLLRMCGLPFVREIGSYSAAARLPDSRAIEREFQSQAEKIRHTLAQTAVSSNLRWSFRVTRGMVSTELLAAAESAGLVTLGRVGRSPGKSFGSTAQAMVRRSMCPLLLLGDGGLNYPLTLLYTGTAASARALRLAITLMTNREESLRVLFMADMDLKPAQRTLAAHRLTQEIQDLGLDVVLEILNSQDDLDRSIHDLESGTLILPGEHADLLDEYARPVILVP